MRRARHRREALRIGLPVGLVMAALGIYSLWRVAGWRWWYVPLTLAGVGLWLARLETDATEEASPWFWRPPK